MLPADEEQQICVQLFGSKPDQFESAVAAVEERVGDRLTLIDINMACPARKVVTKGEGSALMRTPDLAEQIVEAAVGAAHVPVTVKIRKGFYAEDRNAATFAQMLEGAGAAAVAVHGRCATQLYTGQADWSVVDEVADAVEIPVIGSGDVFSAEDAAEHLQSSGASAVFIARGIYGNPWVFGDAHALALDGTPVPVRSSVERLGALREHLTLTHELLPLMSRARTYASWYLKGMPHAAPRWCAAPRTRSSWHWSMISSAMWWPARPHLPPASRCPRIRWRPKGGRYRAVRARAVLRPKVPVLRL